MRLALIAALGLAGCGLAASDTPKPRPKPGSISYQISCEAPIVGEVRQWVTYTVAASAEPVESGEVATYEIDAPPAKVEALGDPIFVSSHVLYEIEALTTDILVVYRGQVLAEGNVLEIRRLIDRHPHRIRVECDRPRALAGGLAGADHVARLHFERGALLVETRDPDRCYDQIAAAVLEHGVDVRSLGSPDNNLGAVFEYLTGEGGRR